MWSGNLPTASPHIATEITEHHEDHDEWVGENSQQRNDLEQDSGAICVPVCFAPLDAPYVLWRTVKGRPTPHFDNVTKSLIYEELIS